MSWSVVHTLLFTRIVKNLTWPFAYDIFYKMMVNLIKNKKSQSSDGKVSIETKIILSHSKETDCTCQQQSFDPVLLPSMD